MKADDKFEMLKIAINLPPKLCVKTPNRSFDQSSVQEYLTEI